MAYTAWMPKPTPDAEYLRSILNYDPETGIFTWKVQRGSKGKPGAVAGSRCTAGYLQISVDRKLYIASRLAWKMHYGNDADGDIDHKNLIETDDRIINLREASDSQNKLNSKRYRNNTTGFKGVSLMRQHGKYRAEVGGRYLGLFKTAEEAYAAYCQAAKEIAGPFFNPG